MNRSFRPLTTRVLAGVALIDAILVVLFALLAIRSWIPIDSRGVAVSFRENSLVLGLVAALTGLAVGRLFLPTSVVLGRSSARSSKELSRGLIAPVCLAHLTGYAAGMAVALALVGFDRAGEVALPVLAVCLGLLALSVWGFLIGSTVKRSLSIVATVVVVIALVYTPLIVNSYIVGNSGESALSLGMVWAVNEPSADLTFHAPTEIARALYFLMIALAGVLVYSVLSRVPRSADERPRGGAVAAVGVVVAVICGVGVAVTPQPFVRDGRPIPCESSGPLEVCEYEVYGELVPAILTVGRQFSDVLPGVPIAARPATEPDESAVPIPHPRGSERDWTRALARSYADHLSGVQVCLTKRDSGGTVSEASLNRSFDLSNELARRAGAEEPWPGPQDAGFADRLASMSDEELSRWYLDSAEEIGDCALAEQVGRSWVMSSPGSAAGSRGRCAPSSSPHPWRSTPAGASSFNSRRTGLRAGGSSSSPSCPTVSWRWRVVPPSDGSSGSPRGAW